MADKVINIKLKIDNKEAVASIALTDDNLKALYNGFKYGKKEASDLTTSISQGFNNAREIIQGVKETWSVLRETFGAPITAYADFEQAEVSFEVLLGSAEKAKQMIEDLRVFGATTPLEFTGLQKNAQLLLNFGTEAERILPTLKMIGDISGGNAQKMDSLTLAFAQMSSTGRLMGQDLLQMINAGFNPLQIISEQTGKSIGDLKKEMEQGAISSEMVADAFATATSEGGRFFEMLEKQSEKTAGKLSNFNDNITLIQQSTGEALTLALNPMLDFTNDLISDLNRLDPRITGFIGAIGTLGVALITLRTTGIDTVVKGLVFKQSALNAGIVTSIKAAAANAGLTASNITLATSFRGAAAGARAFFTALGPAGWLMLGIGTLVTVTSLLSSANEELSETEIQLRVQKEKISDLTTIVRDNKKSLDERKNALEEIQKLDPEFLKNIDLEKTSTEDLTTAINENIAALEKRITTKILEDELENALRAKVEAEAELTEGPSWFESILYGNKAPSVHINNAVDNFIDAQERINEIKNKIADNSSTTGEDKNGGGLSDQEKDALFKKQREELAEAQRHAEVMLKLETDNNLLHLDRKIKHFDQMIRLYRQFGQDATNLLNQRTEAEAELEKRIANVPPITIDEELPDDELLKDILDLEEYKYSIKRKTREDELNDWYRSEQERLAQYEDNIEAQKALDDEYTARKIDLKRSEKESEIMLAQQTFGMLASVVNQNTVAGKAIATANAIINTYEGATKALAQGGFWGILQMATVIAAGMAQVNEIMSVEIPQMPGYAKGGRLRKGESGFVEGFHDEIIAPEKTFVEIFKQELRPQIYSGSSLTNNDNSELLSELKTLNKNFEYYAENPVAPVITKQAVSRIYNDGSAMNRKRKM